jgi:uncharacterized damage-inducible protein DinB
MLAKDILITLYGYNTSANARILDCAARLSQSQLTAASDIGPRSLQDLLVHMLQTEWLWRSLSQFHQMQVSDAPREEDLTTIDRLKERWQAEEHLMQAFLSGVSDEELAATVPVKRRDGAVTPMVLWHMLMQPLTHSMQHRTEVAVLLTRFGQSPGDLDFIFFV